jgi:mono/diheme cytochrome c family protein
VTTTRTKLALLAGALLALALGACRGQPSEKPPLYVFPDMKWQKKIQGQEAFGFWPDGRGNRLPVPGTVARGQLQEDPAFYQGKVGEAPVTVDEKLIAHGEERYDIYCAPCHDRSGTGKGMVARRGFPAPTDLTNDRVRGLSDGEIFGVISHGVRNMPGYAYQIPVEDRWAIVVWVRVLGRAGHATVDDVPGDQRGTIREATP